MEQAETDRADLIERLREAREEAAEKTRRWNEREAAPWLYDLVDRAAAELPKPVSKDDRSTVEYCVQELVSHKLDAPEPSAEDLDALVVKVKRDALKMRKWRKEGPARMLGATAGIKASQFAGFTDVASSIEKMTNPLGRVQKTIDQMLLNPTARFDTLVNPASSMLRSTASIEKMVNPTKGLLDGHRALGGIEASPVLSQLGLPPEPEPLRLDLLPALAEREPIELPVLPARPTREDALEQTAALLEVVKALQEQNVADEARHREQTAANEARHREQTAANEARHREQLAASDEATRAARRSSRFSAIVAVLSLGVAVVTLAVGLA